MWSLGAFNSAQVHFLVSEMSPLFSSLIKKSVPSRFYTKQQTVAVFFKLTLIGTEIDIIDPVTPTVLQ